MVTEEQLKEMVEDSDAEIKGDLPDTGKSESGGSLEQHERRHQIKVATWIDATLDVTWNHTPNEIFGKTPVEGAIRKKCGVKAGVPDVMIFDSPPEGDYDGVAIELKRPDGYPSDVTDSQQEWLDALEGCGWLTKVCFGADEAISFIKDLGYGG